MSENSVEAQKTEGEGFLTGMFLGAFVAGSLLSAGFLLSGRDHDKEQNAAVAEAKEDGLREGENKARTLTACDQIAQAWPETTGWNVGDNDCDRVGWEIFSGGKYVTMSQYKRIPRK